MNRYVTRRPIRHTMKNDSKRKTRRFKKDSSTSLSNLKRFLNNALSTLMDESDGTMYIELTDDLYAVCAFVDGDVRVKIAYNSDDLQMDYDWDWYCPIDKESGDVLCVEESFDKYNVDRVASYIFNSAKNMQNEIDEGTISLGDSIKKRKVTLKKPVRKPLRKDSKKAHFKDSKEIARQLFVSLIKYGDNPYEGYAILRDGNFVKRIYAESDKDAIKQFNDYLKEKRR